MLPARECSTSLLPDLATLGTRVTPNHQFSSLSWSPPLNGIHNPFLKVLPSVSISWRPVPVSVPSSSVPAPWFP